MAAAAAAAFFFASSLVLIFAAEGQQYNAIFSFGDSISDTGNLCVNGRPASLTLAQPPYGETYFRKTTCRCSDGRLVVDFLAQYFGLPLLPPSKASGSDFRRGANMAIIGATTLDFSFFQSIGLGNKIWNNGPLNTQIQWFQSLIPSICSGAKDCKSYFASSLFILGEFGGNDYNAQLFSGRTPDQASTYTPNVIRAISDGVEQLIALGAANIVVPGVLPVGCFPLYLSIFQSSNAADYDGVGCLQSFNKLAKYHNSLLQTALAKLQSKYAAVRIMYADFYSHVYQMVSSPGTFGFSSGLEVCCGAGGGKYNYDNNARCGMAGSSACGNPAAHLSWDGIHMTERAHKIIADGWLNGAYCHPAILHS